MARTREAFGPAGRGAKGRRSASVLGALLLALAAACSGGADIAPDVTLGVTYAPDPPSVGPTTFTLALTDPDGGPVEGAVVEVEGNMSHAGMVPSLGTAVEVTPGQYLVELELTMGGDWFLLVEAELADGRKLELTHDLPGVRSRREP